MNGITTDFITSGIKVLAQKSGDNTIVWQIDGNGNTVGFNYNGTPYFYIKNAQGDIIAIADISGNIVAKYTYDSWGKLISIKDSNDVDKTTDENFIGYVNPIRYRGYYYDSETGLYYLNARYYDPEVGRFISADETLSGGYNLFEYCYNNPINFIDQKGNRRASIHINIGTYNTQHEAAIAFGMAINNESIRNKWEYDGAIIKLPNGRYTFTYPETNESYGECFGNYIHKRVKGVPRYYGKYLEDGFYNNGEGCEVVANIHTHGCCSFLCNVFSGSDVVYARGNELPLYLVNPAGELRVYDPNNANQDIFYRTYGELISSDLPRDPNTLARTSDCNIL